MHLVMADQGGNSNTTVMREYRKGNWTVGETMVLIEAKQMDDERRMKRSSGDTSEGRGKPAELRWKWVEDYCWRKGCLRSQNQCNDKWDNLMRDYKKVRDYERKVAEKPGEVSYWKMERNERKDKNLPSNMLLQIYEALVEVVEKKGAGQRVSAAGTGAGGSFMVERPIGMVQPPPAVAVASLPTMLQHHHHHHQLSAATQMLPLPLPPSSSQQPPPPAQSLQQPPPGLPLPYSQPPTVGTLSFSLSPSILRYVLCFAVLLVKLLEVMIPLHAASSRSCDILCHNFQLVLIGFWFRIFMLWRSVIAQILIQVSIQTHHQQREEEEEEMETKEQVQGLQVEAVHMNWVLQFPKVLPS